jgi:hypothetical protein
MRKALGLMFAASLLVSITAIATSPVGAAANTKLPKCKSLQGTQTFTPGLPIASSSATVKPTTKTTLTVTGCTGAPGITKGTSTGSTKATKATNCKMLFANAGKPAAATKGTIKWNNGQTSTTSNVLTVTGTTKTGLAAKLVSTYTAGLGKGSKTTITVNATPNAGWCSTKPFTKTTFKSTSIK